MFKLSYYISTYQPRRIFLQFQFKTIIENNINSYGMFVKEEINFWVKKREEINCKYGLTSFSLKHA